MDANEYIRRGLSLMEADRLSEADRVLRKAHAAFPDNAEICVHLGWVYYRREDRDRMRWYARHAMELDPRDPWVAVVAARLLLAAGDYDLVRRALRLARQNMTDDDGALVTAAVVIAAKVLSDNGHYEAAEEALRDIAAINPDDQEVGLSLFVLLANLDRPADALAQIEAMLERAPDDEHLHELAEEMRRLLP